MSQPKNISPKIVMYSRPGCPDVARASYYLRQHGLDWDEINIDADPDAEAQVIAWVGRAATPTLWIGETMLVEPDSAKIDAALAKTA